MQVKSGMKVSAVNNKITALHYILACIVGHWGEIDLHFGLTYYARFICYANVKDVALYIFRTHLILGTQLTSLKQILMYKK